jgi:hypothetical protein
MACAAMLARHATNALGQEQYAPLGHPLTIEQVPDKKIFYNIGNPGIPGKDNEGNTSNAGMSRAVLKFARQASLFEQATRPWLAVQDRG